MTVPDADIAQLRRMVAEPTETTYTDEVLTTIIESFPMMDERGVAPYYYDVTTNPPTQVAVVGWYPTWDKNAAAAAVWEEKAAAVAQDFDYPTYQGGTYQQSRVYQSYLRQARYYAAKRQIKTGKGIPSPSRNRYGDLYIANLAEGLWDE